MKQEREKLVVESINSLREAALEAYEKGTEPSPMRVMLPILSLITIAMYCLIDIAEASNKK